MKKAFTLIEVTMAILISALAVTGITSLFGKTMQTFNYQTDNRNARISFAETRRFLRKLSSSPALKKVDDKMLTANVKTPAGYVFKNCSAKSYKEGTFIEVCFEPDPPTQNPMDIYKRVFFYRNLAHEK